MKPFFSQIGPRLHSARLFSQLLVILLVAMIGGCGGSSSLENMWKAPSFREVPVTKMLVIAARKDQTMRRLWEDGFVSELQKHGMTAVPSYRLFEQRLPDSAQAAAAVRSNGYDGVLVSRVLPPQTNVRYVPGYISTEPATAYDPWTQMIYSYDMEIEHPGYTRTEKVAQQEIQVWSTTGKGQLIWSGTTQTIDPSSSKDIENQIVNLIVPELANQGIIPGEKITRR